MWPQALQMTRDECRGILRRLELESYSHVISVFRAQGGLSDNKTKLLEELRGMFHISQERHRAEARRVANDEQLCTIAEAISGPNTWQEWSREGRRSYPMLPRVAPQTALALIANNVATETASENAKLPYPADTAAQAAAEHANTVNAISGQESAAPWEIKREVYVVTDDPFKMPDIPVGNKKSLKRNISESHTGNNKKRIVSDSSPSKQQHQKQFHHITANSAQATSPSSGASNIRKLYHNHNSKAAQNRLNQQQLQKPKLAMKKSAVITGASIASPLMPGKRQATPAKSGRKSNSKMHEQKQQHILQQQQVLAQSQQQLQTQTAVRHVPHVVGERADELNNEQRYAQPQIAASKKDITKNLTKLQLPSVITSTTATVSAVSPTARTPAMALSSPLAVNAASARIDAHQMSTVISPVASGGMSVSIPAMPYNKVDKQLISTPVQKIILEDRLPPPQPPGSLISAATSLASAVVSTASTLQIQSTSTPQIMTLPQISAAATKLRAINTTILPPGTKLTTKKLSSSTLINASSIGTHGNEINNEGTNNSSNTLTVPAVPTHTPPAIIQIQSTNSGSMTNEGTATIASPTLQSTQQPAQGKVLTTKLLPIVLSGTGAVAGGGSAGATLSGGVNVGNTVNITKIETLNNGATLVSATSGVGCNNPNASLSGTTTMIKNMGSTLLLSPNQSSSTAGSALFSTLTSGASVFRKSQIIKTGTIGVNSGSAGKLSGTFNTSNSGPQIISNIKLTPAITTTSVTSVSHSNQHQQSTTASSFLQHQLKNISTPGIRTSVKICQSPNGKVFIQSANVDGASKGKLQGAFSHKILPNAVVSSSAAGAGTSVTHQPQRIAIQKVQIIPAPLNSPGNLTSPFHTATTQSHSQSKPSTTTNTITLSGNKSNMNMVFVPSVGGRTTSGTITLSKSANVGSGIVASKVQQSSQNPDAAKPNVVIIGSSPAQSGSGAPIKTATFIDGNNKYNITTPVSTGSGSKMHLEPNQMITEDTPVDILNMPIIVDSGDGTNITMGNNIGDTVTVLPTSLIESAQKQQQQQQQQQQPSTIILGATDWEMELDQATAVAAATKAAARTDYSQQSSGHGGKQCNSMSDSHKQQMHDKESIDGETIIIDDSFEDVIVEEQEEGDTDAGAETEGTVDGEMDEGETGEDTGGEEGQEMTEKAYTIFSGNESEGELLPPRLRETVKLKVGQLEKTYNTITTAANSDDEPIEVIDDDDDNVAVAGNQKLFRRSQIESEKNDRKLNEANVNNGSGNNNSATVECDTDAGFDETIVADIDENTAIEYIEEEVSHVTHAAQMHEKIEVNDVDDISVNATKRQLVENEVIVLDDNDGAALKTTATLSTAPVADSDDAMEDEVLVGSDMSKGLSGSSPTTINVGAVKPVPLTVINSKNVAGLE